MTTITICLPLPDRLLHPNARCHWAKKAKAVKLAKEAAFYEARLAGVHGNLWKTADVKAVFYFQLSRTRDKDNSSASLKAYLDGIVQAGLLVNDSGLSAPVVEHIVDHAEEERVVLTFTKIS